MKGLLVLQTNNSIQSATKISNIVNSLMGYFYLHQDKHVTLSYESIPKYCKYSSMFIQNLSTTESINYVSKGAKIVANFTSAPKMKNSSICDEFIDSQKVFNPVDNFHTNIHNCFVSPLVGEFSGTLAYLTFNTRPFVALINKTISEQEKLFVVLVHSKEYSFLVWAPKLEYDSVMKKILSENDEYSVINLPDNATMLIQPICILNKFSKWLKLDKLYDKQMTVEKLTAYLTRKTL